LRHDEKGNSEVYNQRYGILQVGKKHGAEVKPSKGPVCIQRKSIADGEQGVVVVVVLLRTAWWRRNVPTRDKSWQQFRWLIRRLRLRFGRDSS